MSDSKIVCPFDRVVTEVPEGNIDFLRKNFSVLELIDEAKWKEKVGKCTSEEAKKESDEYSKELALKIPCDENKSHLAVLYCLKCETHLCKWCSIVVHSSSSISNHTQVPLTEKPEPLEYCSSHPHNIAELICMVPDCRSSNRLMCYLCHQYGKHKGHEHSIYEDKVDSLNEKLERSKKVLAKEIEFCEEYIGRFEKSIATYSDTSEQIDTFYESLRNLADEFKKNAEKHLKEYISEQKDVLEESKKKYEIDLEKLIESRDQLENLSSLGKKTVFEQFDTAMDLMNKANVQFIKGPGKIEDFLCSELQLPTLPELSDPCIRDNVPNIRERYQMISPRSVLRKKFKLFVDDNNSILKDWFSNRWEIDSTFISIDNEGNKVYSCGDDRIIMLEEISYGLTSTPELPIYCISFADKYTTEESWFNLQRLMSYECFYKLMIIVNGDETYLQGTLETGIHCVEKTTKKDERVCLINRDLDDFSILRTMDYIQGGY